MQMRSDVSTLSINITKANLHTVIQLHRCARHTQLDKA